MVPLLDINRVASLVNLVQSGHQQVRVALHDGLLVPHLIEDNCIVCSILYTYSDGTGLAWIGGSLQIHAS